MIVWCAYCCSFLGEKPPYDNLAITHSICVRCVQEVIEDRIPDERLQQLTKFQHALQEAGHNADVSQIPNLLKQAAALDVQDSHMLLGLVAPLLWQLGVDWQHGSVSVAMEHRFTAFFEATAAAVWQDSLQQVRQPRPSDLRMLLVPVGGNYHTLGLRMIGLWLAEHAIESDLILPGLPAQEIADAAADRRCNLVGLSIAIDSQLPALEEAIATLQALPQPPRILVGGALSKTHAIKSLESLGQVQVFEEFGSFEQGILRYFGEDPIGTGHPHNH